MICVKTKFKTEDEAERSLIHIKTVRRKYRRDKKPNRSYLCEICGYYHLTSKDALPEEVKLIHEDEFRLLIEKNKSP